MLRNISLIGLHVVFRVARFTRQVSGMTGADRLTRRFV